MPSIFCNTDISNIVACGIEGVKFASMHQIKRDIYSGVGSSTLRLFMHQLDMKCTKCKVDENQDLPKYSRLTKKFGSIKGGNFLVRLEDLMTI